MVDTARGSILNFDRGIARILVQEAEAGRPLPHQRKLSPSETIALRQISGMVDAKNLSSAVARALAPSVGDRQVLRQEVFEPALAAAAAKLRALVDQAGDPGTTATLKGMIGVLEEQQDLQDTLTYFRSLLIAG